jgi:type II secretory pathway pseudopilin PulG
MFSRPARDAMTLMELMVALVILVGIIGAVLSGLLSTHNWQQHNTEEAVARRTAQLLAERVIGASWGTLGQSAAPWSWHRREVPRVRRADGTLLTVNPPAAMVDLPNTSPRYPPMTERAADPRHDLAAQGLITDATGMRDLKVYLEYYLDDAIASSGGDLLLRGGAGDPTAVLIYPRRAVTAAEANVDRGLPEDADAMQTDHLDLSRDPVSNAPSNAAVLVRVLVTWTAAAGGARRYELLVARKQ